MSSEGKDPIDGQYGSVVCRTEIWLQSNSKQIYLGTRYTGLLGFILFIIASDSGSLSCRVRLARP